MAKILEKRLLAPKTHYLRIDAPLIATHAQPGQFIVLRLNETGERVPFTIADIDPAEGSITLVVQEIGKTTQQVGALNTGDEIRDVLGPLGAPTEIEDYGTVVLLGGGFGNAAIHLMAKAFRKAGNKVISIIGARTRDLLIMEDEMRKASDELIVMTDDGSYGRQGFVITPLKEMLEADPQSVNHVVAVGPIPMMRAVGEVTRPYSVKTFVSLNPVMVDGTGMCGGCRVQIGDKTKFACVDGPDFDAHLVNFDELVSRNRMYMSAQEEALHQCKLDVQTEATKVSAV